MQNIRPFEVDDIEYLLELDQLSYRQEIRFSKVDLLNILRNENTLCFLYQLEESEDIKIIGSFIIKMDLIKRRLILISLVVHPEYQRRKYGKEQFEFIIKLCHHLRFDNIILQVDQDNEKAVAFFDYFNFQVTEHFDNFIVEGLKGFEMQLKIKSN